MVNLSKLSLPKFQTQNILSIVFGIIIFWLAVILVLNCEASFIFSVVIGIACAILCLLNNEIGLIILLIVAPFRGIFEGKMFDIVGANSFNLIYLCVWANALLLHIKHKGKVFIEKNNKFVFPFLIFWFYYSFNLIRGFLNNNIPLNAETIINSGIKPLQYFSLFFIFIMGVRKNNIKRLVFVIIFVLLITNFIITFHAYSSNSGIFSSLAQKNKNALDESLKYESFFLPISISELGYLNGFLLPLFILIFYNSKKICQRIYLFIVTISAISVIISSNLRGVWLTAFMGVLILGFFKEKRLIKFIIVFILLLPLMFTTFKFGRFEQLENIHSLDEFSSYRISLWSYATKLLIENPEVILFGGGMAYFEKNMSKSIIWGRTMDVHNGYLENLMKGGLIGLVLLFWLYFCLIKETYFVYKSTNNTFYKNIAFATLLYIILTAIGNMSTTVFPTGYNDTYILLLLACIGVLKKDIKNNKTLGGIKQTP